MKFNVIYVVVIFMVISTVSFGQKRKRQQDFTPIDVTQLSEGEALKAEAMIIDAERELILENYFKALELFKAALEITPNDAVISFKIAEILTKNGESQNALAYAGKASDLDPHNKYYLLLEAEIYKSISNYQEATKIYQHLIDNIPGTETYLFDLAILYQFQGESDKALETYARAEQVFGMNEIVLREKQKIYQKKKDYKSLIDDWDKLIKENPGEDRYTIELTEFLISHKMLDEAKERLEKLKNSQHGDLLLSKIALSEGDTQKAMDLAKSTFDARNVDYKSKLQLLNSLLEFAISTEDFDLVGTLASELASQYPDKYEVQAYAGDVMYRLQKQEEARKYYLKAVQIDPANFGTWQNILNIEAALNQYDSVIVHAERALEYFPNQAALYYFAGTGYLINKEYKRSVQILDQGRKYATDPKLVTIFYGQMGDAYNSMKQYDRSYEAYESALKANPNNDHVLNNYSYFLSLRNEKMDKALEMSGRLVEMHPDNPTYLDTHGWVLYTVEKYEEALIYLRKAANLQEDGTVIEHYGDVLYKLGKVDEAVEQWKRASLMDDASKNIDKKIAERKLYE
ncbi:MAG: tetratricopeptide repeat protein [Marinoscillum sp.]